MISLENKNPIIKRKIIVRYYNINKNEELWYIIYQEYSQWIISVLINIKKNLP